MRKGNDVIGKVIVTYDTGKRIEHVQDLIFDQKRNRLLGFLVREKGFFRSAKVLPLQEVQVIGSDAIVVHSSESVVTADQMPEIKEILHHNNILSGTKILTTDGLDLGTMSDLFFDEVTGAIEGYEASGGLFADAYSGRSFVPAPETLKIGEDVAFVPPATARLMEEQVGGIKGAMQATGDKLQESAENAQHKLQETAETAGSRLRSTTQTATDSIQHSTNGLAARNSVEQAKGRRATQMVRSDEGAVIAAPGQIVTDIVITRAQTYGKEATLLSSVGLAPSEAAFASASDSWAETKGKMQNQTTAVQENLGTFWRSLQAKTEEFKGRSARVIKEQRIEQSIGRPVNRVILDPQDKIILNVGELITHQAIRQADEGGVLNILLGSVYTKEPVIAEEELRAPEHGMAALKPDSAPQPQEALSN